MFDVLPMTAGPFVAVRISGELTEDDVRDLRAYLTDRVRIHGPLRILFVASEWTRWDWWRALWEVGNADLAPSEDVHRLAMVGKGTLDHWMTEAMKPFAHARVRWFPSSDLEKAWRWLVEVGSPLPA